MTVRCLIVDDSPTMRALLAGLLRRDPEIEVIGTAQDAHVARAMIRELNPDVITLDVEMPGMNGLEFLEKLMRLRPTPVVMCSTLTAKGAEASLHALELGAIDCFAKPEGGLYDLLATDDGEFAQMVKQAAQSHRWSASRRLKATDRPIDFRCNDKVVAIGASTGGVEALSQLLLGFPENCPPTVIVQHMPAAFTASFAERLDKQCAPRIKEAVNGERLLPGHVYIAPGGHFHLLVRGDPARIQLIDAPTVSGHRPSVDVLFRSIAQHRADRAVGLILTGMGRDGAAGLLEMREAGAHTIGQDQASCVVYGMPRVAAEIGACDEILPLGRLGKQVLKLCSM